MNLTKYVLLAVVLFAAGMMFETAISVLASALLLMGVVGVVFVRNRW